MTTPTEEQLADMEAAVRRGDVLTVEEELAVFAEVRRLRSASPGHAVAMRVAEAVVRSAVLMCQDAQRAPTMQDALHIEAALVGCLDLSTIVTRILGEPSDVEKAGQAYLDACYAGHDADRSGVTRSRLIGEYCALRAAREKAGQ